MCSCFQHQLATLMHQQNIQAHTEQPDAHGLCGTRSSPWPQGECCRVYSSTGISPTCDRLARIQHVPCHVWHDMYHQHCATYEHELQGEEVSLSVTLCHFSLLQQTRTGIILAIMREACQFQLMRGGRLGGVLQRLLEHVAHCCSSGGGGP